MSLLTSRRLFRRAIFAAWAMLTLILVFCVLLLVAGMVREGRDPLAMVKEIPAEAAPPPVTTATALPTEAITLYFADNSGRMLLPETRRIEWSDYTSDNCRRALEALIHGPEQGGLVPILPRSTKVRSLFLMPNGELVVNFSIELELEHRKLQSTSLEGLMLYGIVNTLTQGALQGEKEGSVQQVRVLIEDAVPRESFPAHIDASIPLYPDPAWIGQS